MVHHVTTLLWKASSKESLLSPDSSSEDVGMSGCDLLHKLSGVFCLVTNKTEWTNRQQA